MARNQCPGTCCSCGQIVEPNKGHFQRFQGRWIIHHARCPGTNRQFWPDGRPIAQQRASGEVRT